MISALLDLQKLFRYFAEPGLHRADGGVLSSDTFPAVSDDLMKVILSCCKILVDAVIDLHHSRKSGINLSTEPPNVTTCDDVNCGTNTRRVDLLERSICEIGEQVQMMKTTMAEVQLCLATASSVQEDIDRLCRGIEKHALFVEDELNGFREVTNVASEFMVLYQSHSIIGRLNDIDRIFGIYSQGSPSLVGDPESRSAVLDHILRSITVDDPAASFSQSQPTLGFAVRDGPDGPCVTEVFKGFPAESWGIKVGDVIVAVSGIIVTSRADVQQQLSSISESPVTLSVRRDQRLVDVCCAGPYEATR